MSLQVWLPLNGTMENQGLLDLTPTQQGTISWVDGKIGKCLSAGIASQTINGISYNSNLVDELGNEFSAAVWVKPLGTHVHYNGTFVSSGNWNGKKWAFGVSQDNSKVDVFCQGYNTYLTCAVPVNVWTHLVCVHEGTTVKLYKNGEYVGEKTGVPEVLDSDAVNFCVGRETYANGYFSFNGNLNDLRIYNHALSAKEVKELSKGLVLHYKLNKDRQILNNCFSYPSFDTSNGSGGWSHWGSTGHIGTYGQITDKKYIFRPDQTYAHWVADGSSATMPFLIFQSPAFEGGYRSMQCICKEENSLPITNDICYPTWNARNGGAENNKWTSIQSLGDGFYFCKCENISQDGSNDLVGIYIKPGYKVYFSEIYLENDKQKCSNIFFNDNNIEYDCSGYKYDGIINNSPINSNNSVRYNSSISLDGINQTIQIGNLSTIVPSGEFTFNIWFYKSELSSKSWDTIFGGPSGFELSTKLQNSTNNYIHPYSWGGGSTATPNDYSIAYNFNKWNMLTMVRTTSNTKFYLNGELKVTGSKGSIPSGNYFFGSWRDTTSQNYKGLLSDARIYATALSADDILELYQTAASIDNKGNLFCGEMVE